MKTFEEWIKEEHPEALEEGWMKNLAVGGALLGAGMGVGGMMRGPAQQGNPQQAVTQQAQQNPQAGDTGYTNYGSRKGGSFTRVVSPNGEISYISKNSQTPLAKQIVKQPVASGWNKVAQKSWPLK